LGVRTLKAQQFVIGAEKGIDSCNGWQWQLPTAHCPAGTEIWARGTATGGAGTNAIALAPPPLRLLKAPQGSIEWLAMLNRGIAAVQSVLNNMTA